MAFPETILDILVEAMIDGSWTDITADVDSAKGNIEIVRGQSSWGDSVDPARCSVVLDNRTGKYSPRNPTGTYYGKIGRNTQLRVSVNDGDPYLYVDGSGQARTPDAAALDIVGDIDIRAEISLDDWNPTEAIDLAGKYVTTGNQRSWLWGIGGTNRELILRWSSDGTDAGVLQAGANAAIPIPTSGRIALRSTLDVSSGDVKHYTAPSIDGTWVQLGATITSAATSIFSSTAPLDVGDNEGSAATFFPPSGRFYHFELRNGIDAATVADIDFTAQTLGDTSFVDDDGLTWTVNSPAEIINRKTRFVGEIVEWPYEQDDSGNDIFTRLEARGIMRRLGQPDAPLESPLRRRIPAFGPLAYWPMEDESSSTRASSPIEDVVPLFTSGLTFGAEDTLAGSKALPTVSTGGGFNAPVPVGSGTSEWQTEFVYNLPTAPGSTTTIMGYESDGTVRRWRLRLQSGTATLQGNDLDGALTVNATAGIGTDLFGDWNRWIFYAEQDGANVDWTVIFVNIGGTSGSFSGTYAGTVGRITEVRTNAYGASADGMAIGHVGVFETIDTTVYNLADHGFNGEIAAERIERLGEEEDIPIVILGDSDATEPMGPQKPGGIMDLIDQAAASDHGILYESRSLASLAFRGLETLYNQTPALSLSYETDLVPPFLPVPDDKATRNKITVHRIGGGYGYAAEETGPLSILAPPNGVGPYPHAVDMSLEEDWQARLHAGWLRHVGTVDEERYPVLTVNLARNPELIEDAASVDIGDRIKITDTPLKLPPGDVDLLVLGYTETLAQYTWTIQYNCVPASPYTVATADGTDVKAGSATTTLNEALTTTETGVDVAVTAPLWTTSAGQAPFDIIVGGERMTVTAVVGATSPQTFTVTRSVNGIVKEHASGAVVKLFQPAIASL